MAISYPQEEITQAEYFLDADNGVGLNTKIDIESDIDITENIVANIPSSTPLGYHKLYIRTKDALGNWSQTTRKNIEVFPQETENAVVMGEFYLDTDPSFNSGVAFEISSQSEDVMQDFIAEITDDIPTGYHKLYGRVKDPYGNWSQTFRKNIEVVTNQDLQDIVEIEYFFGDDLFGIWEGKYF